MESALQADFLCHHLAVDIGIAVQHLAVFSPPEIELEVVFLGKTDASMYLVLGLQDVVFLDYEDSMLQPTLELRRDIAREIRRYQPDVVICQYPLRNLDGGGRGVGHPDHLAAGEATLAAVFPAARDHMTFPELLKAGFEPHKVAEVWITGHPESDLWIDVAEHMHTSIKAIMEHSSQINGRDEAWINERIREWRRKSAADQDMEYAEAYKRITFRR